MSKINKPHIFDSLHFSFPFRSAINVNISSVRTMIRAAVITTFLISKSVEAQVNLTCNYAGCKTHKVEKNNSGVLTELFNFKTKNNNSILLPLKIQNSNQLLLEEQTTKKNLSRENLIQDDFSEAARNETYDTKLLQNFSYYKNFFRAKRDWEGDNFTAYFNDTFLNNSFSEEDLWELITPKSWTWILIIFHSLVFVIGIIGNILVCVAVYRNHTMRTVTNYFIVNLAVADFLVILFCLPPSVVWDVTLTWFFGIAMCKIVLYFQVSIYYRVAVMYRIKALA